MGQFWAVLVRMEDRRECSDKKIVSRCRDRARRVYYSAVFEIKKEILTNIFRHPRSPCGVRAAPCFSAVCLTAKGIAPWII